MSLCGFKSIWREVLFPTISLIIVLIMMLLIYHKINPSDDHNDDFFIIKYGPSHHEICIDGQVYFTGMIDGEHRIIRILTDGEPEKCSPGGE